MAAFRPSDEHLLEICDFYCFEAERLTSEHEAFVQTCIQYNLRPESLRKYLHSAGRDQRGEPVTEEQVRDELKQKLDISTVREDASRWRQQAKYWKEVSDSQQNIREALKGFLPHFPAVPIPDLPHNTAHGEALALAQWSDWHAFRTVSLSETEGMFEYNFDIFCRLFWDMLTKTVDIINIQRSVHKIPRLWIVKGGDMMNDEHRVENIKSNELWNSLGVFKLAVVTVQGIRFLLKHVEYIDIDCVVGNEPRIQKEKQAKHQWNNWDFVFYNIVQMALADEIARGRIRMFVPMSPDIVVEQCGFNWLITHGDKAKSWNGIPFYGINRFVMRQHDLRRPHKLLNPHGQDFHYTLMHDKHTLSSLNHDTCFINGALCGTDEYAKNVLGVGGPRMQRLMFINDSYGPFCQYPLFPMPDSAHPFTVPADTRFADALHHDF